MDDWSRIFLGVIAVSAAVQALILVAALIAAGRLSQRFTALEERVENQLRPAIEETSRIARNLADLSERAREQGERVSVALDDTLDKVRETTSFLRTVVTRSAAPLVQVGAFWAAVGRGVSVLRSNGHRSEARGVSGARAWEERGRSAPY